MILVGCSTPSSDEGTEDDPSPQMSGTRDATTSGPAAGASNDAEQSVVGTVVRFRAGDAVVDVTIGEDTTATRDFLSMLPTTLELEEFDNSEKIAYLPRELDRDGTAGSDPEDGDLIYYTPWGNIGFFYDASGFGHSDQTLHLGTYDATEEELSEFEGRETTVEIVD
ncbi:hypothetical protein LY12_000356 [Prauserella alba]|nr:hypothetical protein [Prauserella alba]